MSIVDIPLSFFTGEKSDIIERLYEVPTIDKEIDIKDNYQKVLNLETPKNYNPTRVTEPSYIYDDELKPIFGSSQICIYDNYYLLYLKLKEYIYDEIKSHSMFRINIQKIGEDDNNDFEFEITNTEDIKNFIVNIVTTVPCSLYDIVSTFVKVEQNTTQLEEN
jgi:hypothetical protein